MALLEENRDTIEDRATLAAFMDEEAEALARSAVDEYTRARVLHDPDELFAQPHSWRRSPPPGPRPTRSR